MENGTEISRVYAVRVGGFLKDVFPTWEQADMSAEASMADLRQAGDIWTRVVVETLDVLAARALGQPPLTPFGLTVYQGGK